MTEQSYAFWKKTEPKGSVFIEDVFKDIEKEELTRARVVLQKILSNLTEIENRKNCKHNRYLCYA